MGRLVVLIELVKNYVGMSGQVTYAAAAILLAAAGYCFQIGDTQNAIYFASTALGFIGIGRKVEKTTKSIERSIETTVADRVIKELMIIEKSRSQNTL